MTTNESFPKFDLPVDFIADDSITGDILNYYGNFPCKIKAGVFVLCTEGMVRAPIICWRFSFVRMMSSLFFLIHSFRYTKFRLIPVFLLPVSRPILCFRAIMWKSCWTLCL